MIFAVFHPSLLTMDKLQLIIIFAVLLSIAVYFHSTYSEYLEG